MKKQKRKVSKKLFVAKIFREPLSFTEVCRLYCWGKSEIEVEKRVVEVLNANHDLKALGFEPELLTVQVYTVEKKDWEAVSRKVCCSFLKKSQVEVWTQTGQERNTESSLKRTWLYFTLTVKCVLTKKEKEPRKQKAKAEKERKVKK